MFSSVFTVNAAVKPDDTVSPCYVNIVKRDGTLTRLLRKTAALKKYFLFRKYIHRSMQVPECMMIMFF